MEINFDGKGVEIYTKNNGGRIGCFWLVLGAAAMLKCCGGCGTTCNAEDNWQRFIS